MGKTETIYPIETTGGRIQRLRHERGMTREQFYDAIYPGRSVAPESKQRTVKHWESEETQLDCDSLAFACAILDCDSDYLLLLQEEPHKEGIQIAEKTGLTYEAVETLEKLADERSDILTVISALITSRLPEDIFSAAMSTYKDDYTQYKRQYVPAKRMYAAEKTEVFEDLMNFINEIREDGGLDPLE